MKTIFVYTSMGGEMYRLDVQEEQKRLGHKDISQTKKFLMRFIGKGKHFEEWQSLEDYFIKRKDGTLENVRESNDYIFCGLYAATGYSIDKDGVRVNVGKEFAGLSSKDGINWYKE